MRKRSGGHAPEPPAESIRRGRERRELKHLSTSRKGKKLDSLSSGERTGISPNRGACKLVGVAHPGSRESAASPTRGAASHQDPIQPKALERAAVGGDSPVGEGSGPRADHPSSAGHVEPGVNSGGRPPKAKYSSTTDSARVARAKGEKNPCEGSEKNLKPCTYQRSEGHAAARRRPDGVPFA